MVAKLSATIFERSLNALHGSDHLFALERKLLMTLSFATRTIVLISLLFLPYKFAYCQKAKPSELAQARLLSTKVQVDMAATSMTKLLNSLSDQTGACFVCDDVSHVKSAPFKFGGNLKDALIKLGNVFDYRWEFAKSGLILMRKSFDHVDDYPNANLPELSRIVNEVLNLMKDPTGYPDKLKSPDVQLYQFMRLLNPPQMQILRLGGYIPSNSLAPNQFSELESSAKSFLCYQFVDSLKEISNTVQYVPRYFMCYNKFVSDNPAFPLPETMVLEASYPELNNHALSSMTLRFIPRQSQYELQYLNGDGHRPQNPKKP